MIIRKQRRDLVAERLRKVWESNYRDVKPFLLNHPRFAPQMNKQPDRPAVCVGAGPSLDKNIKELRPELYDIFACDKVVPRLVELGKKPQYVVALNSEPTDVLKWLKPIWNDPQVTLIMPCVVWPGTWQGTRCKTIFINNVVATNLDKKIEEETGHPSTSIGSNAGTFAYLAACYTGHNPIAYVGMNFSFLTREEVMATQEPDDYNVIEFFQNGERYWLTVGWLDMAEAFQENCRAMGGWFGIHSYNCTEGGINYSKYVNEMTLKDFNAMLTGEGEQERRGVFYGR